MQSSSQTEGWWLNAIRAKLISGCVRKMYWPLGLVVLNYDTFDTTHPVKIGIRLFYNRVKP